MSKKKLDEAMLAMAHHEITCTNLHNKILKLEDENRLLREELAHYRTAVAGVRWLLKQGGKRSFQL